ncbi:unnamed protein product [Periconia digitata]|uniref:Uncharacterized protein n=1 Tax=Periconia digitata TaxID=1303443 RepID=A0A9W4U2F8_9PLEO|nr:unnamed protein product [Periconia digitata]
MAPPTRGSAWFPRGMCVGARLKKPSMPLLYCCLENSTAAAAAVLTISCPSMHEINLP